MLTIKKLTANSKEQKQLASVENIIVAPGTISLVVGKNGSGKTSFLHGLFLHPSTTCTKREVYLNENDISNMFLSDMYKMGIQYVPQHLMSLPGVSFISFLHIAYEQKFSEKISLLTFADKVKKICNEHSLPVYLTERNVHENLSGGERKMQELIQVTVLKPQYLFLDEIDAGLDHDAKNIVAKTLNQLKKEGVGIMAVSHSFEFAELLAVDTVHLFDAGTVVRSGNMEVLREIQKDGFIT